MNQLYERMYLNNIRSSSCWAFAATAAIDANYKIKMNIDIETSQQELVDCSGMFGNNGCDGGMSDAGQN